MAKMTEKEVLTHALSVIVEQKTEYLNSLEYQQYALQNGNGGNLEDYLRTRAKYKVLSNIQIELMNILTDNYEW